MEERLRVQATLRLMRGGKAFGPGVAALLDGIERCGSLRQSAAEMGMSYNKAWHVVRDCEANLGFALLARRTGGVRGGGAELTEAARDLLSRYRAFDRAAREELDRLAGEYFGEVFGDE